MLLSVKMCLLKIMKIIRTSRIILKVRKLVNKRKSKKSNDGR